jgi:uncharacterized OB-fold protein
MTGPVFAPQPPPDELTRPFWDGCLAGELRLQKCGSCGHVRYPISTICPVCLSGSYAWQPMSGGGTVQSFVIFDRAYRDDWKDRVPYVVALVELDEGPVFLSNVVDTEPSRVHVGQRVSVVFAIAGPDGALPQFAPTDSGPS